MKVKISTEASVELTEAAAWYELEILGLGEQLITIKRVKRTLLDGKQKRRAS